MLSGVACFFGPETSGNTKLLLSHLRAESQHSEQQNRCLLQTKVHTSFLLRDNPPTDALIFLLAGGYEIRFAHGIV